MVRVRWVGGNQCRVAERVGGGGGEVGRGLFRVTCFGADDWVDPVY